MDLSNLKIINEQSTQDAVFKQRHDELLLDNVKVQETFVKTISSLVEFLSNQVTRTEVVNQLKEVGTPDVAGVVGAVDSLHETLKTHENTDLEPVTRILQDLLLEAKEIPKSHNKIEIPKPVDYSKQFKELEKTVKAVEKAVKSQQLVAEAPIVNVPETQVNVDAPNLKPIKDSVDKSSKDVVKAVKGIKLPEFKTDPIEKLLKKTNKLLEELPDYMPSGGGGGSSWAAVNSAGTPLPLNLDADGKLIVAASATVDTTGLATDSNQTNGTQKTQIVDNGGSIAADVLDLTNSNPLTTALVDANGDQITSFGGGTQYTEGDTDATFTGTISLVEGAANAAVTLKQPTQPTDTQPVSAASLPLPTGAATAANQQTDALTDTQLRATAVPVSGTVTSNLGTLNGAATTAKQDTIIGHLDGVEGLLTTIDADTGTIATEVAGLLTDTELRATPVPVSGTVTANLAAGTNNIGDVDVLSLPALPAGTNAIGKLSANSGVDIGDVDVTSAVSATIDHGSNRDIDTTAEQITSTSFACKFGLTLKADITNTGIIYIGNSDVTAGTTAATDGFPLSAGETLTLEVTNANIPYAIASANNQIIYWVGV